jgi:hypothetical protein
MLSVVLPLLSLPQAHAQLLDRHAYQAMDRLSIDAIKQHVTVLGHDSLQGRATGSKGGDRAAEYIADVLRSSGVEPFGDPGSFFQYVPLHGSRPLRESDFCLFLPESTVSLELWDDYILFNTGAQTFIPTPVKIHFVGYGIVAPEYDYNDYRGLDVENELVVFLSGEPPSTDLSYFSGEQPTTHSDPVMKHRIALSRGAKGSIMISQPRENRFSDWNYWRDQFLFEDIKLPYNIADNLNVLLSSEYSALLFESAPYSLEEVFVMDSRNAMRSFPLRISASFRGRFAERNFVAPNVIGRVEGSDPLMRSSHVVICAHYDHLGIGSPTAGDSIYNGVVDNALGVSAALELARLFATSAHPPHRSLIFLFTTGEEKGLLGSKYYCDHPKVPLHETMAALNIDGLAIIDTFGDVAGVGAAHSTLEVLLENVAAELGLKVSSVPPVFLEQDPFYRSDQLRFAQVGIPSILILEGQDYLNIEDAEGLRRFIEWGQKVYHTPFDDLDQPINFAAVLEHSQLLFAYAHALSNTYIEPQWHPGSRFINARLRTIAENR